jgi:type 1 glutamine amidotransferase
MFLLTTGELPMNAADKQALVAFVSRGGGLIGFHSATDTFHHWAAYKEMIGAEFSHHPHPSRLRAIVTDHSTPATHPLPASFLIHEEFYVFKHDPRPHVHVLAELDTGPGGPDRPLVWCRRFGRGRVYYDALGHFSAPWHSRYSSRSCRAASCGRRTWPARRAARRRALPRLDNAGCVSWNGRHRTPRRASRRAG